MPTSDPETKPEPATGQDCAAETPPDGVPPEGAKDGGDEENYDIKTITQPTENPKEKGGRAGPDPTRYGDWEKAGRCIDF